MSPRIILIIFLIIGLLLPGRFASANSLATGKVYQQPEGPVYIVQEGDSLWDIALRFKVSMDDLAKANGISDPSQLVVGARLVIPGLSGIQGVLTTSTVSYGETLAQPFQTLPGPGRHLIEIEPPDQPQRAFCRIHIDHTGGKFERRGLTPQSASARSISAGDSHPAWRLPLDVCNLQQSARHLGRSARRRAAHPWAIRICR